ncbi:MAG: AMP-binding protein [Gammaproteobacteria bacterium]|nr:AMP-binding protein [Gammaproteobacteria bacterium]
MSLLLEALRRNALTHPDWVAVRGDVSELSYGALQQEVDLLATRLASGPGQVVAQLMDNGPAWAVTHLATLSAGKTALPLPGFFSPAQQAHSLVSSGAGVLLSDSSRGVATLAAATGLVVEPMGCYRAADTDLLLYRLPGVQSRPLPLECALVTYTSGTSGRPKGVCLSLPGLEEVTVSVVQRVGINADSVHLAALPLSTLLEGVGGLYCSLLAGGLSLLPGLRQRGYRGLPGPDLQQQLQVSGADNVILVPEMLRSLNQAVAARPLPLPKLRFVAVGGAAVPLNLLDEAERRGLPVYQGYGLSECGSVVAVNTMAANRPGSVGQPLPHVQLRVSESGEIHLRGPVCLGYLQDDGFSPAPVEWPSGDLGVLDDAGFLYIRGRCRDLLVTAYGRNVSPGWVEAELSRGRGIRHAAVYGDGMAQLVAVIDGVSSESATAAVARANANLPEYARIAEWVLAAEPFSGENGLLTAAGALCRQAIWAAHQQFFTEGDLEYSIS